MEKKILSINVQDMVGLSPMQEGILFHSLKNPENLEYHVQLNIELSGSVNTEIFKQTWNRLTEDHEILRTIFRWEKLSNPVQIIMKNYEIPLRIHNLIEFDPDEKEDYAELLLEKDRHDEIIITEHPFRISLLLLEENLAIMALSYHHIILDGWSISILLDEFFSYYHRISSKEALPLIRKPQYKDYITHLNNASTERQQDYWQQYFQNYEHTPTQLPTINRTNNIVINEVITKTIDADLMDRIKQFSKVVNHTPATIFYAVWAVLLNVYSGARDIVYGVTTSGRSVEMRDFDKIAGIFINTLPLRVQITFSSTVGNLLRNIESVIHSWDEYSITPLVDIRTYAGLESKEEFFNSIMVIENYPIRLSLVNRNSISNESLNITKFSMHEKTNFGLTIGVTLQPFCEISFDYRNDMFDGNMIERVSNHFIVLLEQIIANENIKISNLNVVSPLEKEQLLVGYNEFQDTVNQYESITQQFEQQVEKHPNRVAIVQGNIKLTYRELNERANQLARLIQSKECDDQLIIGIYLGRSPAMIISILAVLKSGNAYLPLDPDLPEERLGYMVKDAEVRILITESGMDLKGIVVRHTLYTDNPTVFTGKTENLPSKINPRYLAYIIYTSGTSGKPKGVLIEHRNVSNLVFGLSKEIYRNDEILKVAETASFMFDQSIEETFGSLLLGHTLYIASKDEQLNPERLLDFLVHHSIDLANGTPTMIQILIEVAKSKNIKLDLKTLLLGGEAVPYRVIQDFFSICNTEELAIYNVYGPTECCVDSTFYKVTRYTTMDGTIVPIGKPLSNYQIYILSDSLQLLPIGVEGEIYIAGLGVSRGYLNEPELTKSKFIPDPFHNGSLMYRTGDRAKRQENGDLVYLGRIDSQIKIRGYRIEPKEIESVMIDYPPIQDAVVIEKLDDTGSHLCGYFVAEQPVNIHFMRQTIARVLPAYMIPQELLQITQIPFNKNGKLDKQALLQMETIQAEDTSYEYIQIENDVEKQLQEIWCKILGIHFVGPTENFFEIGGHSFKATRLATAIQKEMNVELPLSIIFDYPTIREMAQVIKNQEEKPYQTIPKAPVQEYYSLSSAQKRYYTLEIFGGSEAKYNSSGLLLIEGFVDIERMQDAFCKLIKRHKALRTSFHFFKGEIWQRINPNMPFRIQELVIRNEEDIELAINDFIQRFDLTTAPLMRVGYIKKSDTSHILIVDMHHIIVDGVSKDILLTEFIKIYQGVELTQLDLEYVDYATWQKEHLRTTSLRQSEQYWLENFQGFVEPIEIETDYKRPAIKDHKGDRVLFEIDSELQQQIINLSHETGTTLFMILMAAYQILLSKYTHSEEIIVGTPVAGRDHPDLQSLVGVFLNTLPLLGRPSKWKTFREFLMEVKSNFISALEHQDFPFEELVRGLQVKRDRSRNPLINFVLVLQNTSDIHEQVYGDTIFRISEINQKKSDFDLFLEAEERNDCIMFTLVYATSLFKEETIRSMINQFMFIVNQMVDDPNQKIGENYSVSNSKKEEMIDDFANDCW